MMATLKEENGSEQEPPGQEEKEEEEEEEEGGAEEEEQTAERRHVEVLLDLSEEDFMEELEPYEDHCYSGWEEAVHGWTRAAPMSCILSPLKQDRKLKNKEADNPTPSSVNTDADSSVSAAEHHQSHVGSKKSMLLTQHTGSCSTSSVAADWTVLSVTQKTTSRDESSLQPPHHLPSKYSDNRPTKPQRPNNTVVPIRNFTFLPPIKSPHLNPHNVCSGRKAPEGGGIEETCFMFDKRTGTRGPRVDRIAHTELPTSSAAQTSKYWTCQHNNPPLFSAVSVSIPRRYQVKPDPVHRTSYSVDKRLTKALHAGAAAGSPAHMFPSNTVCM